MSSVIDGIIARLYSADANDRVKAAGEIGEIGTETEAPLVLKIAYEDEASTVRQMAIQSFHEIMKRKSLEEIVRAARSHFDEYVRIYAISILGQFDKVDLSEVIPDLLHEMNPRIKIATVKAVADLNYSEMAPKLLELFPSPESPLLTQVIAEAFAIMKYKKSKDKIKQYYVSNLDNLSLELKTAIVFALSSFGDKSAKKSLKNDEIDNFFTIKIGNQHYRGRKNLLKALNSL